MSMSINEAKQLLSQYQKLFNSLNGDYKLSQVQASELSHSIGTVLDIMRRYQMLVLDYKADKVAMLEDLKKEMNPVKECEYQIYGKEHWNFVGKCQDVIQQKIDALKGEQA